MRAVSERAVLSPRITFRGNLRNIRQVFDVVVPAQKLFGDLFVRHGFANVKTRVLRRRTSKKELYEYLVSAERP